MGQVTKEAVFEALGRIVDPAKGQDIVAAGMVQGVAITGGAVGFAIEVDPARGNALEPLRKAAEEAVKLVPGVESATVVLTAHYEAPGATPQPALAAKGPPPDLGGARRAQPGDKPLRQVAPPPNEGRIDGVDKIIAVASGKAASESRRWPATWPWPWRRKVSGWACWMQMSTARPSRA